MRAAQQPGWKANRSVNSVLRHSYTLEKLDAILKSRGLDATKTLGEDAAKWADPEVQAAIAATIEDANRVQGTLSELTPIEQRYIKQTFPFWPWMRHITALTMRASMDYPARAVWLARLGAIGTDNSPQDVPPYLRGSIETWMGLVDTKRFNPFADVGNMLNTGQLLRSTSPLIKLGIGAAFGKDANNNLRDFTHAPKTDDSIARRLMTTAYQATRTIPLTREGTNLLPNYTLPGGVHIGPERRYGTGQEVINKDTGQPFDTSRIAAGARLFSAPVPVPLDQLPQPKTTGGLTLGGAKRKKLKLGGAKRKTLKLHG